MRIVEDRDEIADLALVEESDCVPGSIDMSMSWVGGPLPQVLLRIVGKHGRQRTNAMAILRSRG